jgi:D-alanyl-D-alanine carboxypeptidase
VPGAAGWVRNERGSLRAASGLANRRTRQPMRPELRFRAGSMTKSLVAAVVLRLAAEGRLSLADPLERWLPGTLRYGDRVSLRQLLNHTGGVPHRTATLEQALYASRPGRLRAWTPQALVALVAMVADQPPAFPAGTAWSYSNTGYVLLGLVVEAASQRTLGQELGRSILGPLGLRDTLLPDSTPEIPGPSSHGYSLPLGPHGEALDGPLLDFTVQNPSWAGAAGALVSTLPDLTRFFRALLGGRLLPPPLLAEMTTMVEVPPGSIPLPLYHRYGLGLLEVETPAGPLLGNAGGIPGFLSIVLSTPDGRRQLSLMINALLAPAPVYEAFIQGSRALGRRLLS